MTTPPLPRVLFVDDEQRVLDGLAGSLWKLRRVWNMTFVCGGPQAVALIESQEFDAIVSDMRMPLIDGEGVLRFAQERAPGTVRIILSGQTERAVILRATNVAHQFLTKPCRPEELRECLGVLLGLSRDMGREVRDLVCAVGRLPVSRPTHDCLTALFAGTVSELGEVARCAESDPALAAKFLHVANAGFFAPRQQVRAVDEAVSVIGIDAVRLMVGELDPEPEDPQLAAWQAHAAATRRLLERMVGTEEARLCGILHSLGKRILLARFGPDYAALLAQAQREGAAPLDVLERERFGFSHDEVAGNLVRLWGISPAIADAIRQHCHPSEIADPSSLTLALHTACALSSGATRLGAEERLAPWRVLAGDAP